LLEGKFNKTRYFQLAEILMLHNLTDECINKHKELDTYPTKLLVEPLGITNNVKILKLLMVPHHIKNIFDFGFMNEFSSNILYPFYASLYDDQRGFIKCINYYVNYLDQKSQQVDEKYKIIFQNILHKLNC
jgi:hypothetical protein